MSIAVGFAVVTGLVASLIIGGTGRVATAGEHPVTDVTQVSAASAHLRFTLVRKDGVSPNLPNLADRTSVKSPLLLFLAATRAKPMDYRSFLSTAKRAGYHVLALDYSNTGRSVQATCRADSECYTAVQRNRLTGEDPGMFSSVSPADSIMARLTDALRYLRAEDPDGGWNRYRSHGRIDWSRVVVAGHSQGGGESAFISHIHRVRGALMFSSPVETVNGVSASWMHKAGKTPASRLYAFQSRNDMFFSKIRGSWRMLGMDAFGKPQNVADTRHYSSHELVTTSPLGNRHDSHLGTIMDRTPRGPGGVPIFQSVWKWMLHRFWTNHTAATTA